MTDKEKEQNVINVWGIANIGCTIENPTFQTLVHDSKPQETRGTETVVEEPIEEEEQFEEEPNYFAPRKNISVFLCQDWFDKVSVNKTKYTKDWRVTLMVDLMASEYGTEIAKDWADPEKRTQVKCAIVGALIDTGVLKSSYNALAPELDISEIAVASLAKYMGYGKKQPYYDWLREYVKK